MICAETGLLVKPSYGRLIYWKLFTLIPFSTAILGIVRYADNLIWLIVYFGLCATHMLIEIDLKISLSDLHREEQSPFSYPIVPDLWQIEVKTSKNRHKQTKPNRNWNFLGINELRRNLKRLKKL